MVFRRERGYIALECGFVRQHLHDLISGEIEEEHKSRIDDHIQNCDMCRSYVDNALAFKSRIRELMQVSAPPGLLSSITQLSEKG